MSKPKQTMKAQTVRDLIAPDLKAIIDALVTIVKDDELPASARVSAAKELLDRHDGRPRQTVEATVRDESSKKYDALANQYRLEFMDKYGSDE